MMVFLDLCLELARRKGFTDDMINPDGPSDPTPLTWKCVYSDFKGRGFKDEPECVVAASELERKRAAEHAKLRRR